MSRTLYLAFSLCLVEAATLVAQQRYSQFDSVEIDVPYPDNWRRTIISPQIRVAFEGESERYFVITRSQTPFPQTYNEAFAQVEESSIRDEYPTTNVTRNVLTHKVHGRILQMDFVLPGIAARNPKPLRLRHVSIPLGRFTYRITCVSRDEEFSKKYDVIFNHMISNLVITPPTLKEGS